jgi:hypothetical protein
MAGLSVSDAARRIFLCLVTYRKNNHNKTSNYNHPLSTRFKIHLFSISYFRSNEHQN